MKINSSLFLIKILIILQFMNPIADFFPSYIQMGIFALWVLSMLKSREILNRCFYTSLISLAIFFITILRCLFAGAIDLGYFSPMQAAIGRYQFFVYVMLFAYVNELEKKEKEQVFNIALLSIMVTVLVSLYYLRVIDPQAIRNTQGVSYFGVGDFQLMYAIAVFLGPYFIFIKEKIRRHDKFMMHVICFILMIVCIILCNLVTSVVISIASIAILYFISLEKKEEQLIWGIVTIVFILMKSIWASLLKKIAETNIFYWTMNDKLNAIANILLGDMTNTDTLSLRVKLTNISLDSFKEHPFMGINFKNHQSGIVGGHAQWVDDLARFGILGNIIIWLNYFLVAKKTINISKTMKIKRIMGGVWIVFLVLGFLNPCLSGTILTIIFIVIPCMEFYFVEIENVRGE